MRGRNVGRLILWFSAIICCLDFFFLGEWGGGRYVVCDWPCHSFPQSGQTEKGNLFPSISPFLPPRDPVGHHLINISTNRKQPQNQSVVYNYRMPQGLYRYQCIPHLIWISSFWVKLRVADQLIFLLLCLLNILNQARHFPPDVGNFEIFIGGSGREWQMVKKGAIPNFIFY